MGGRGAPRGVSRTHLRPSGHHFFNFCGPIWVKWWNRRNVGLQKTSLALSATAWYYFFSFPSFFLEIFVFRILFRREVRNPLERIYFLMIRPVA